MNQLRKPRAFSMDVAPQVTAKKQTLDTKTAPRKPRALAPSAKIIFNQTDEAFFANEGAQDLETVAPPSPDRLKKPRFRAATLIWSALAFLVSASLGLWLDSLVRNLMTQNIWLGRAALSASAIFVLGVAIFCAREMISIWKLRAVNKLRSRISNALELGNTQEINAVARALESHFANHPKTAKARKALADNRAEIMDAQDRMALTERELLTSLDHEASQIVMNAAKRVSVVTAVSPRALVDIGYVVFENIRLIRVLSELYGGRASLFGTVSLIKNVVAHLAVTGTLALTDGIVQQLFGHGLASRLSVRLGEGVVNGLMTVRVGISAIDVCRPAPFNALARPKISDFAGKLFAFSSSKENKNRTTGAKGTSD